MDKLQIALLQLTACWWDQEANLAKGEEYCRQAAAMGADIALFPEMWNTGYTQGILERLGTPREYQDAISRDVWRAPGLWKPGDEPCTPEQSAAIENWHRQAVRRDSQFVNHFRLLARELRMAIAITYLEAWDGPPRNSVSLIDRHGEIVMTYAKVHTCDFDPVEYSLTPGDDFFVCDLDTAQGAVRIGAMICYDREYPESARILMLKGAEIILTPNACHLDINRLAQFRARAYENMVGVAMANYAAPQNNGHSVAFDAIACERYGNFKDTLIIEAGESEGDYLAQFDMAAIRDYRQRETHGNAFRKPHLYGLLTSPDVNEPFVRVNAQGESRWYNSPAR